MKKEEFKRLVEESGTEDNYNYFILYGYDHHDAVTFMYQYRLAGWIKFVKMAKGVHKWCFNKDSLIPRIIDITNNDAIKKSKELSKRYGYKINLITMNNEELENLRNKVVSEYKSLFNENGVLKKGMSKDEQYWNNVEDCILKLIN